MKQVNKDEFYTAIGPLDVTLSIIGEYPYTTEFKMRHSGKVMGKTVDFYPTEYKWPVETKYFIYSIN